MVGHGGRLAERSESRAQVGDQVVRMLNSDRYPDRRVRDAEAVTHGLWHTRMCRGGWVAGERLCAAQADGELEQLKSVEDLERLRLAADDVERERRAGRRALLCIDMSLLRSG